eukprot:TRINITY_DN20977_c0_g3_i1.p1 TRINITY_DN20977_c0_g3~~TRINITY_DN20977_c0_g3_i1.p1  ORF type:complete len:1480 (+),score=208.35 TRINITY_DN20977_c0_g3_i1:109-4548(+)
MRRPVIPVGRRGSQLAILAPYGVFGKCSRATTAKGAPLFALPPTTSPHFVFLGLRYFCITLKTILRLRIRVRSQSLALDCCLFFSFFPFLFDRARLPNLATGLVLRSATTTLYGGEGFGGWSEIFAEGSFDSSLLDQMEFRGDDVTAAQVFTAQCALTLYEDPGFAGKRVTLQEGVHDRDTLKRLNMSLVRSLRVRAVDATTTTTTSTTTTTTLPASGYLGCYLDDAARDLKVGPSTSAPRGMIYGTATCRDACRGFRYMALQDGGLCFCGDAYATDARYARQPDSDCGTRCAGEQERCGGRWRNAVYRVDMGSTGAGTSESGPSGAASGNSASPGTHGGSSHGGDSSDPSPGWADASTSSGPAESMGTTTPAPPASMVEYGHWSACSQPCGDNGLRERTLLCYKKNRVVNVSECEAEPPSGARRTACSVDVASFQRRFGDDSPMVMCEVEPCNRMECVELHPNFNESAEARAQNTRKRCASRSQQGRRALQIQTSRAHESQVVNVMRCAEACRWEPSCAFFTVLRTYGAVASVPWCFAEASEICELPGHRGIVHDEAWDLYRLSDARGVVTTTLTPTRGIVTHTVIWHYRASVLVDEDFQPPYVPDAPSAPAAVSRGASAGNDIEQWVKLTWDAPEQTSGADVLYYKIRRQWWQAFYTTAEGTGGERQLTYKQLSKVSESRGPTTMGVLVSGLQAGRSYTFEVAAVNSEGESEWSPKSAVVRMGAAIAHAEPRATTWQGGDAITVTLVVAADNPVDRVTVVTEEHGRSATCTLVASTDPYSKFTCLTPAWSKLGDPPEEAGAVRKTTVVAYDASGFEIATASLVYADFSCPAHSELKEVPTDDSDDTDCEWFRKQRVPKCEICECSFGYQRGPRWSRKTSGRKQFQVPDANALSVADTNQNESRAALLEKGAYVSSLGDLPSGVPAEIDKEQVKGFPGANGVASDEAMGQDEGMASVPSGIDKMQGESQHKPSSSSADSVSPPVGADRNSLDGALDSLTSPKQIDKREGLAPPTYSPQSACIHIPAYCKALDLPNGRLPDPSSLGLNIREVVRDVREACDPGYELSTPEAGPVHDEVHCLPGTRYQGNFGIAGRPQTFICTEVEKFCTKVPALGGEIPFATIRETVDVTCTSPARDTWPFNVRGSSSRVTCVRDGDSRTRGKFVTSSNEELSGAIQCAGCHRLAIQSDGEQGWITAARVGQRGKMRCPSGWVLTDDFRGQPGPLCTADGGERDDGLLGKWSFEAWSGKQPRCIFEDRCKGLDCGQHGECVIQDEEVRGGTTKEAMTWTKKVPKCMCSGGYRGLRCEQAPPMKCDYQIRYETPHERSWIGPITQSIRPQLVTAAQEVVGAYKQFLSDDAEKEEQVVKALMTRSTRLNNVRVCCIHLDRSISRKGPRRIETDEFETSIENVQITTTGTGIEDAVRHLMTEASLALTTDARRRAREHGLAEHAVSVEVRTVTADLEMPKGLPPEGACMSAA